MSMITPVIIAGGSGTRLWPLSTRDHPKQYRNLVGEKTMLAETMARTLGAGFAPPVLIASAMHRGLVEEQLPDGGRAVFEPFGRNTAPAAVMAALLVLESDGRDGLVLLLPADHHIGDPEGFRAAVERGRAAAEKGFLVTLGITPDRPETGYGYIRKSDPLGDGVFRVGSFVEKPDLARAKEYVASGDYAWNAGIFLYRAEDLLREAALHAPGIMAATETAFGNARREGSSIMIGEEDFGEVDSDSIDYAIMEKTERAAVVSPVTIGWDDIGSWAAVKAFSKPGADTEAGILIECPDTVLKAEEGAPMVAAVGLEGFVIVSTRKAVLVVPEDRAQDVKTIVQMLKDQGREDLL